MASIGKEPKSHITRLVFEGRKNAREIEERNTDEGRRSDYDGDQEPEESGVLLFDIPHVKYIPVKTSGGNIFKNYAVNTGVPCPTR
jgi:hypothetical protein